MSFPGVAPPSRAPSPTTTQASFAPAPGRIATWLPRSVAPTPATWWLPLALIVATEYKFRRRPDDETLAGTVDPFILIELGIYALVAAYLVVRLRPGVRPHIITIVTIGYCVTAAASALYAPYPVLAIVRGVELVIVLLLVLQFGIDADVALVRRFLHGFVVLATVSVVIGMLFVAPQPPTQVGRFTWLYTHSVVAGAMLAVAVVVLFGMWLTYPAARLPWPRWVYGALLVFDAVGLMRTRTRGSIGAAALAIGLMALLWLRARGKRDLMLYGSLAVLGVVLTVAQPLVAYLLRDSSASELASFNRRTDVWTIAWDIVAARPVHGLGLTASRSAFYEQTGLGGAHNAYLNVVVDTGLLGLCWWLGLIGLVVAATMRVRRRSRPLAAASPLTFDTVTLLGIMLCQLVNAMTAEWLGVGVSMAAIVLLLSGAWVLACSDALDALDALESLDSLGSRESLDGHVIADTARGGRG